ncbi:multinuclear nonheme iron-dependent oxidase, partial [Pseudomonas aeruginosa]
MQREFVSGAGLGLRRALLEPLGAGDEVRVDFLEVAPENWIGIGGRLRRPVLELNKRPPFPCPGLSLPPSSYAPPETS